MGKCRTFHVSYLGQRMPLNPVMSFHGFGTNQVKPLQEAHGESIFGNQVRQAHQMCVFFSLHHSVFQKWCLEEEVLKLSHIWFSNRGFTPALWMHYGEESAFLGDLKSIKSLSKWKVLILLDELMNWHYCRKVSPLSWQVSSFSSKCRSTGWHGARWGAGSHIPADGNS